MATLRLFWVCFVTTGIRIAMPGRITRLQSSVELTQQRTLACNGEAVTLSCASNGRGMVWESSDPSLGKTENQSIYTFVATEKEGHNFCYVRKYMDETSVFVSGVLENSGDNFNSSITLIPIRNSEGLLPTPFTNSFVINCTTGADHGKQWEYRVAAVPGHINATCTNNLPDKNVQVEITSPKNNSIEISYYEVSILNDMKIEVKPVQSGGAIAVGVFYPIKFNNSKSVSSAQIVAVDVCNQRSDPTTVPCTPSTKSEPPPTCSTDASGAAGGITTLTPILYVMSLITIVVITGVLAT